jgi:hypothetical protein
VFIVRVEVAIPSVAAITDAGSKPQVTPLARPAEHDRFTEPVNPPSAVMVMVEVAEPPRVMLAGENDAAEI